MRVVFYTRVSTTEQGQNRNGLEAQQQALQAFAVAHGCTVLGLHTDVASGKHDESLRPALRAALTLCRQQSATLLVSKLDRLSRSVQFVSTLMNNGPAFATVEDGLGVTPMMLHLKAMFAENERKAIGERTRAGLERVKARGTVLGWQAQQDPQATQAKAIAASVAVGKAKADAFATRVAATVRALADSGLTYAQVAERLNDTSTPTARNGRWTATTVCRVLKRA